MGGGIRAAVAVGEAIRSLGAKIHALGGLYYFILLTTSNTHQVCPHKTQEKNYYNQKKLKSESHVFTNN